MLGSNPTADAADSTDRNGDVSAFPFDFRVEARSGEAASAKFWAPRPGLRPFRKPASSHSACEIANSHFQLVSGWTVAKP